MVGPVTALENFIFKAFNPMGRATRSEYWIIMPFLWITMIVLAYLDLNDAWNFLLNREKPPMNPLYYSSFFFWILTAAPRLTLTMRRLNDSGKNAKLAFLPYMAMPMFFWLTVGVTALLVASAVGQASATSLWAIGGSLALIAGGGWEGVFMVVKALQFVPIGEVLVSAFSGISLPSADAVATGIQTTLAADPTIGTAMLLQAAIMILGPFLVLGIFFILMILPSDEGENGFGLTTQTVNLRSAGGPAEHNPFAGYAALVRDRDPADPAFQARKQQEVKALYKSRVLGQSSG